MKDEKTIDERLILRQTIKELEAENKKMKWKIKELKQQLLSTNMIGATRYLDLKQTRKEKKELRSELEACKEQHFSKVLAIGRQGKTPISIERWTEEKLELQLADFLKKIDGMRLVAGELDKIPEFVDGWNSSLEELKKEVE